MDTKTRRVVVKGLREADVATLRVLTQDVLALPLNQIDAGTFCELIGLSELDGQVPNDLLRELAAFRDRCFREIADLPDGPVLAEWLNTLLEVEASGVAGCLRDALGALVPERTEAESVEALTKLMSHIDASEPIAMQIAAEDAGSIAKKAESGRTTAKKPKAKKRTRTPAKGKDPERELWIQEYVLLRLANYETGLKEAVIVGGARFKAPWKDVTDREVRSVLRRLAREGKVKTTVGRWLIER